MRESVASLALIARQQSGETEWLVQWNDNWKRYALIGGHKHDDETFRQCLVREINEELGLREGVDVVIDEKSVTRAHYTAWSHGAGEVTAYTIDLYDVELIGTGPAKVAADPSNRWLTVDEIQRQETADGKPVSDTVLRLLKAANSL